MHERRRGGGGTPPTGSADGDGGHIDAGLPHSLQAAGPLPALLGGLAPGHQLPVPPDLGAPRPPPQGSLTRKGHHIQ